MCHVLLLTNKIVVIQAKTLLTQRDLVQHYLDCLSVYFPSDQQKLWFFLAQLFMLVHVSHKEIVSTLPVSLLLFDILFILFDKSLFWSLAKQCTLNSRHYEKKSVGKILQKWKRNFWGNKEENSWPDFYNEGCSFPDIIRRN